MKTKKAINYQSVFRKLKILLTICIHVLLISIAEAAVYPTLPQIFIQTPYNLPVGGQFFTVNTSAAFQAALNTANLGDVIELQAGISR